MRIYLRSADHALRVAKSLRKEIGGLTLPKAQRWVAEMLGYRDLHELRAVTAQHTVAPSLPDAQCSADEQEARRAFQAGQLAACSGIDRADARAIIDRLAPSGAREPAGANEPGASGPSSQRPNLLPPSFVLDPVARRTQLLIASIELILPLPAQTLSRMLLDANAARWNALRSGEEYLLPDAWTTLAERADRALGWQDRLLPAAMKVSDAIDAAAPQDWLRLHRYGDQLARAPLRMPETVEVLHASELERHYRHGTTDADAHMLVALNHAFGGLGLSEPTLLNLWRESAQMNAVSVDSGNPDDTRLVRRYVPDDPQPFCDTVLGRALGNQQHGARARGEAYRRYPDAAALERSRREHPLILCAVPRLQQIEAMFSAMPLLPRWVPAWGENPAELGQHYAGLKLSDRALAALWTSYTAAPHPDWLVDDWRSRPQHFVDFIIGVGTVLAEVVVREEFAGRVEHSAFRPITTHAIAKGVAYRAQHGYSEVDGRPVTVPEGERSIRVIGPDAPLAAKRQRVNPQRLRLTLAEKQARAQRAWDLHIHKMSLAKIAVKTGLSKAQAQAATDEAHLAAWKALERFDDIARYLWEVNGQPRDWATVDGLLDTVQAAASHFGFPHPNAITKRMALRLITLTGSHYREMETERQRKQGDWTYPLPQHLGRRLIKYGFRDRDEVREAVLTGHLRRWRAMDNPDNPIPVDPREQAKGRRHNDRIVQPDEMREINRWVGLDERFNLEQQRRREEIVAERKLALDARLAKAAALLARNGYQVVAPVTGNT